MSNFTSDYQIAREFLHCRNPRSGLMVEFIDKRIVEETIGRYFNNQTSEAGKAKARLLHMYYLSGVDWTLDTISQELGYSYVTIKRYHAQALEEIVKYIPLQYRV